MRKIEFYMSRLEEILIGFLIASASVILFANVIARYVLNSGIHGPMKWCAIRSCGWSFWVVASQHDKASILASTSWYRLLRKNWTNNPSNHPCYRRFLLRVAVLFRSRVDRTNPGIWPSEYGATGANVDVPTRDTCRRCTHGYPVLSAIFQRAFHQATGITP